MVVHIQRWNAEMADGWLPIALLLSSWPQSQVSVRRGQRIHRVEALIQDEIQHIVKQKNSIIWKFVESLHCDI